MPQQKRQFTGKFTKKPFKRSFNSYSNKDDDNNADESSSKRFKSTSTAKAPDGIRHTDEEGNPYWDLGGKLRRVTVSDFNGNVLVSVREYYEKDGKILPGKKGISMTLDQFNQMIRVLPALEEAIGQKSSVGVVRPIYTTSAKHEAPKVKGEDDGKEEEEEDEKSTEVTEKSPEKSAKESVVVKKQEEDEDEAEDEDESEAESEED